MLGRKSVHAEECFAGGFVGVDFGLHQDLTGQIPSEWRAFNRRFIPVYFEHRPDKTSRITAGLACGALWTVAKGIADKDVVLCPDGTGQYRVGEVTGGYIYASDQVLPHRRPVQWLDRYIARDELSQGLRYYCRSSGTVAALEKHREEIERLLAGHTTSPLTTTDESIEAGISILPAGSGPLLHQHASLHARFLHRTLRRSLLKPRSTWNRLEPPLSGHPSDTAPHRCSFFARRTSLHSGRASAGRHR